ncbi:MAG: hypothetical protein RLN72_09700 [Henriciella sp.]
MILQRLATALRKQDWFTVLIETLIVVFGVFIGLQVNNWNEARQRTAAAEQYEERLREDLRQDAANFVFLRDYYRGALKAAEQAYDGLTGQAEMTDAALIVAAFRASQYNWSERHRATFDELVGSGNLELIRDPALRARASGYYAMRLGDEVSQASMNSEYRRAFRLLAPPMLHAALGEQCGDRELGGPGIYTIDYECKFQWPESEVAAFASTLRNDETVLPLLRLRIANLASRDFELQSNFVYFGLEDLLPSGDTPGTDPDGD